MNLHEIELATEGQLIARRNLALGLWAGKLIGLKGHKLEAYVRDVMRSDLDIPGPADIIDKIASDFITHDIDLNSDDIEQEIIRQERLTRLELMATD